MSCFIGLGHTYAYNNNVILLSLCSFFVTNEQDGDEKKGFIMFH